MNNLYITASARNKRSKSKDIGNYLIENIKWKTKHINLSDQNIPYLQKDSIAHMYNFKDYSKLSKKDKKIINQSNKYIKQLNKADRLIIATPMRNFGMPATLKAWFDLVVRVNKTFEIVDGQYKWLLDIKQTYILIATWAVNINSKSDYLSGQIKSLLNLMWLSNINIYSIEGTNILNQNELNEKLQQIKKQIDKN